MLRTSRPFGFLCFSYLSSKEDRTLCWIALLTWYQLEAFRKREPELKNMPSTHWPFGKPVVYLLDWWLIESSPKLLWAVSPLGWWSQMPIESRLNKWVNHAPPSSLFQFLPQGSSLAWAPALTSLSDGQLPGSVRGNKPLPPQVTLGMVSYHSSRNPKTPVLMSASLHSQYRSVPSL